MFDILGEYKGAEKFFIVDDARLPSTTITCELVFADGRVTIVFSSKKGDGGGLSRVVFFDGPPFGPKWMSNGTRKLLRSGSDGGQK